MLPIMPETIHVPLSGNRFTITYALNASEEDAKLMAKGICFEQTVEFPEKHLPKGDIPDHIVGQIASFEKVGEHRFEVEISYAEEVTGYELTQLLNVIFGNVSIQPNVRVQRLGLSQNLLNAFSGPRFGRSGLRELVGVQSRALTCTALKPMGLSAANLARLAGAFAEGGIDLIKDDHGLADQPFSPWKERVRRCADAVREANAKSGRHSLYMPNITGPAEVVFEQAHEAKGFGAQGILIAPGLSGFDAVRTLSEDSDFALPIMSHPSFLGSFVTSPASGISHFALFGQLMRLIGVDASIFPNYGGRFSFSKDECRDIADGTVVEMGQLQPIFPTPGGGMTLDRIPELLELYGSDVVLLVGGGMFDNGGRILENSKKFLEAIAY
ncbi:MAG: RuBisCO large subunit C-terminal-like domain-containing protein [Bacilli bacterium]